MAAVDPRTVQELGGWSSLEPSATLRPPEPGDNAEAVERIIADHFPTEFTTPSGAAPAASDKLLTFKAAPVARVDRGAVS